MKIAILGTRGIPNAYGGFEQFAEYLSLGLVQQGFDVTVYNPHNHQYKKSNWKDVKIVHCYDPEFVVGTIGQFIYDLNCILDCRKRDFDIILQLGYTSSSVWFRLLHETKFVLTTNMDGLEWKRSKYSKRVQQFLKYAEKLAVKHSHHLISDSVAIQEYLYDKYKTRSTYIPYGADVFNEPSETILKSYHLTAFNYDVLIARLEPENSIEIILDGAVKSLLPRPFLVIGNDQTKFGDYLKKKFSTFKNIVFLGGIYDINKLNNIRYHSCLYFHGHTVGGTNPSLLEAMASRALICAHENIFNLSILGSDAYYFRNSDTVSEILTSVNRTARVNREKILNNVQKIGSTYSWTKIVNQYVNHFNAILKTKEITVQPQLALLKTELRESFGK